MRNAPWNKFEATAQNRRLLATLVCHVRIRCLSTAITSFVIGCLLSVLPLLSLFCLFCNPLRIKFTTSDLMLGSGSPLAT